MKLFITSISQKTYFFKYKIRLEKIEVTFFFFFRCKTFFSEKNNEENTTSALYYHLLLIFILFLVCLLGVVDLCLLLLDTDAVWLTDLSTDGDGETRLRELVLSLDLFFFYIKIL